MPTECCVLIRNNIKRYKRVKNKIGETAMTTMTVDQIDVFKSLDAAITFVKGDQAINKCGTVWSIMRKGKIAATAAILPLQD